MGRNHCLQPLRLQMRVDLGRCDVRVPEHRLHGSQIGAMGEQVARKRVSQHMRRQAARVQACLDREIVKQLRHPLSGEVVEAAS